jgi:hypothetical protein
MEVDDVLTVAVGLLVITYLLLYSAFTNQSPLAEIRAAFGRGKH